MEILLYFAKVILTSGVLFFYYRLFLKDKTFHHYNRFYLLAASLISLILPLLKVSYFTLEVNRNIFLLLNKFNSIQTAKNLDHDFIYTAVLTFAFGLVAVFFLTKLIVGLVKIQLLKKKYQKENFEGISFYQTNLEEAPFSFFKNLFWKDSILIHSDLGRQILKHEMVHMEQKHSWDKIFLEITTSLFWFNPFFYLIKKEINLIHEYLADHKALKNSDTKAFAQMLLASHFSGKQFPATSPFLSSNLKKRLTMLKKPKTKFSYARRLLALPLLFMLAFIYMVNAKNKEIVQTNQEIAQYVSNLKTDTIPPPPPPPAPMNELPPGLQEIEKQLQIKEMELKPMNEALIKKSAEAQKISSELRKKSEAMRKLSAKKDFESPQFKALEKEMNQLGAKLDAIYNNEEYKTKQKLLEKNYSELDQLYVKVDAFYNSADFKNQIIRAEKQAAEAEKLVNSPKFKKQIANAEKKAVEAEKLANSAEFKVQIKRAETAAKNAQIAQEDAKISAAKMDEEPDIFIEGKFATKEEMEKLDPNKIESVNVFKKGFEDKKKGEIHIELKK